MSKLLIFIAAVLLTACSSAQKDSCDYTQEGRFYAGRSIEECSIIDYKCAALWKTFTDSCGCGCYEQDIDSYINEVLEEEPIQGGIDISDKTPFILTDGDVELTFYLDKNQTMKSSGDTINFSTGETSSSLPIKIIVKGEEPKNYTLTGSGCSVSKSDHLYLVNRKESLEFKLSVSVRGKDGSMKRVSYIKIIVVGK